MPVPKVERVTKPAILGEAPHWHPTEKVLYWVDIPGCAVRKYNPVTQEESVLKLGETAVSFMIPVAERKNQFVIGLGHDISLLTWNGGDIVGGLQTLASVDTEPGKEGNRLNDGKADPSGRLWAGTIGARLGPSSFESGTSSLYSLTGGQHLQRHVPGLSISNGLAWSRDRSLMYFIDTPTRKVDVFDFKDCEGQVGNRRTIFDFATNNVEGVPDGMTIDADGMLWVACFAGNQVIRFDPETGKLLARVPIPACKVTSVAFGGEHLDELYVTTGHLNTTDAQQREFPWAGSIFRVRDLQGVKGLPPAEVIL